MIFRYIMILIGMGIVKVLNPLMIIFIPDLLQESRRYVYSYIRQNNKLPPDINMYYNFYYDNIDYNKINNKLKLWFYFWFIWIWGNDKYSNLDYDEPAIHRYILNKNIFWKKVLIGNPTKQPIRYMFISLLYNSDNNFEHYFCNILNPKEELFLYKDIGWKFNGIFENERIYTMWYKKPLV